MPFRESQNSGVRSPGIEEFLNRALAYVAQRHEDGYTEIVPVLLAERLGVSSIEALSALMVLEDRGALEHFYRIYCRTSDGVLNDVKTKKEVAEAVYCRFCDRDHTEGQLNVELMFRVVPEALRGLLRTRAVA